MWGTGSPHVAGWNMTWYSHSEILFSSLSEIKPALTFWPRNLSLEYPHMWIPMFTQNLYTQKTFYDSFVHNWQNMEIAQMSFKSEYRLTSCSIPNNLEILSSKKEQTFDTHNNSDEFHRHCSEWQTHVSKYFSLSASVTRHSGRDKFNGEHISCCQRLWVKGEGL